MITVTTRLGLTRWDSDDDDQNRTQFDTGHANLEELVAIWHPPGLLSARPAVGDVGEGRQLYTCTDLPFPGAVYYDDGTNTGWALLNPKLDDYGPVAAMGGW